MDTQYSEKINSTQYWNQRFAADWKENNGMEQSRFFSRIAVDNLPAWFIRYVKQNQPTFCDWGCAMGNGTKVLQDILSLQNITGIDFSEVAIEQARSSYPSIPFISTDILQDENFPRFDILFSSNTLEHFEKPWEVLEKLSRFANKFIVILIPFQEYDRHFEHFYTFDTTNIPTAVRSSHFLTHFTILNAAEYPASYWNGHQILLIYSAHSELSGLGLTLADLMDEEYSPEPKPYIEIVKTIDRLTEAFQGRTGEWQVEQKQLQEGQQSVQHSLMETSQSILRLKEQIDGSSHLLDKRLDAMDNFIAANGSEREALFVAIQSLHNEMIAGKNETMEKLLLLSARLDAMDENLSRGFFARIRNLFSKPARSKN